MFIRSDQNRSDQIKSIEITPYGTIISGRLDELPSIFLRVHIHGLREDIFFSNPTCIFFTHQLFFLILSTVVYSSPSTIFLLKFLLQ